MPFTRNLGMRGVSVVAILQRDPWDVSSSGEPSSSSVTTADLGRGQGSAVAWHLSGASSQEAVPARPMVGSRGGCDTTQPHPLRRLA